MRTIDPETLRAIRRHFHEVIRGRAGDLVDRYGVGLPDLSGLVGAAEPRAWLPIPGMYGGFSYWLDGQGSTLKLVVESWCRVVGGSGQRHEITAVGSRLVAEGFV